MALISNPLDSFEHVVVLMLENRSFDNLLGYLYGVDMPAGRTFDGLAGKDLPNPIPDNAPPPEHPTDGDTATEIRAKERFTDYHSPYPDPGEDYPHVNTQLWDTCNPGNYNLPVPPTGSAITSPTMRGFVNDYVQNYPAELAGGKGTSVRCGGKKPQPQPTYDQYRVIMDSYPAEKVSVLSELARGFAVFDHWHCSVPSQTWCNRAFWHAATSYGQVINGPSLKWLCGSNAPNLFTRLVDRFGDPCSRRNRASKSAWRVYSPAWNFISLTYFLHLRKLFRYDDEEHLRDLERFFEDCASGELPRYTFLEPLFLFQHNDQHPSSMKGLVDARSHVGSVVLGENLILRIYDAIRNSESEHGNNWKNTLLVITHDEHGGCFDHVVPPEPVVSPSGRPRPGQDGFTFDRLGIRVPMVMVSAHIRRGTIVNEVHDHTSFLATMEEKWKLPPLTRRDAKARPFTGVFNSPERRDRSDWPAPRAHKLERGWDQHEGFKQERLHGMQRDLLHAAALRHGLPRKKVREFETVHQAHQALLEHVAARRGRMHGPARIFLKLLLGV